MEQMVGRYNRVNISRFWKPGRFSKNCLRYQAIV